MSDKEPRSLNMAIYSWQLMKVQMAANLCGYAISVHGSMARDFDLIAIPWVDSADSADELIARVCADMELTLQEGSPNPGRKPHGRLAYTLLMDGDRFIDLSVMPREQDHGTA